MKVAVIWWIDSSTDDKTHELYTLSESINPLEVISSGILVENNDLNVVISRDLFKQPVTEDTVKYRICIPKCAVKKMVVFELEEKE